MATSDHRTNRALLRLYKDLQHMPDTPEVRSILEKIQDDLESDLQQSILNISEIGKVIGYERVRAYFSKALEIIDRYHVNATDKNG